jgi:hypothetical protein
MNVVVGASCTTSQLLPALTTAPVSCTVKSWGLGLGRVRAELGGAKVFREDPRPNMLLKKFRPALSMACHFPGVWDCNTVENPELPCSSAALPSWSEVFMVCVVGGKLVVPAEFEGNPIPGVPTFS